MKYYPPPKFILLWIVNSAVIVGLVIGLDFAEIWSLPLLDWEFIILLAGWILARIENTLWDKFHKRNEHNDPWEK